MTRKLNAPIPQAGTPKIDETTGLSPGCALLLSDYYNDRTPNDAYFRKSMECNTVLGGIIRYALPNIADQLDTDSAELVGTVFIGDDLRERRGDTLARVPVLNPAELVIFLYILLEHKSYMDKWLAMQVSRYVLEAHDVLRQQKHVGGLPPIEPIVVYDDPKSWTCSKQYHELLNPDCPWQKRSAGFEMTFIELNAISDEELEKLGDLGIVLQTL